MSLVYYEDLPYKGKLTVNKTEWYIQYYFIGPDTRYRGENVVIRGEEIEDYIRAWKTNFMEYEKMKLVNTGLPDEKKGDKGMVIKVSQFYEGVCLKGNNMPISTRKQLNKIIESYEYAIAKAAKLMK